MLNIGICDDFPIFCEIIETFIRQYGEKHNTIFNIWHFESGEDLIDMLNSENIKFDLLFLDQKMKKLTGLETAKRIRQMEFNELKSPCNIVFVTSMDNLYELKSVKPLRIIRKPVNQVIINEILASVLSEKSDEAAATNE